MRSKPSQYVFSIIDLAKWAPRITKYEFERGIDTVHLTKKYIIFEQNQLSFNLLRASFTRRIARMQKGAFQNIEEPFQKSNSNFTSLQKIPSLLKQ